MRRVIFYFFSNCQALKIKLTLKMYSWKQEQKNINRKSGKVDGRIFFFFLLPDKRKEKGRVQSNIECWMCYFWVHLLSCGADRMIFGGGDGRNGCQKANNFHSKLWQRSGKTISSSREFSIFQVCLNIHRWQVVLKQNCEVENIGCRALWVNQSPAIYWAPSLHTASCFGG